MNRRSVFLNTALFLVWGVLASAPAVSQCSPDLDRLLVALQSDKTSNDAMQELLRRGSEIEVRVCLARRLPVLLNEYKRRKDDKPDFIWGNEARVAGELKIAEAVPALARQIDMPTSPGMGGSLGYNFLDHEAASALIGIGEPAVPAVIEVLKHGSPMQREMAVHVLREIGTDAAWQALEDDFPGEKDPKVRRRIQEALNSRR